MATSSLGSVQASPNPQQQAFESSIQALESELANAGAHLEIDASARQAYARQIRTMADELRQQATSGRLTWHQAALQAQEARNAVMDIVRGRSTPVGRALAGGALAGLACGPGAPVGVVVGAFVGGALAAFGADYFW